MTMIFMDGFDHYGSGAVSRLNMLAGMYADVTSDVSCGVPAWGTRTGALALQCGTQDGLGNAPTRLALGSAYGAIIMGFGFSVSNLPNTTTYIIVDIRNGSNQVIAQLRLMPTGNIQFETFGSTTTLLTAAPVIVGENWHFLEMKFDPAGSSFRLDVDGNTVITGSPTYKLSGGTVVSALEQVGLSAGLPVGAAMTPWFDDLNIKSTAGSHNNSFQGDLRIATLFADANGADQGWTPQYRHRFGTGILDCFSAANACISTANSASTNLGTGDWTVEGSFRFGTLPTGGNKAQLAGKWDETNNRRSWQMYLGGPTLENGNFVFRISTDGTSGTVNELISYPWTPDTDTWYHIAIVRASGELLFFVDGVQMGLPIADANTYFVGVEPLSICGQVSGTNTVDTTTTLDGWVDEFRQTVGFARYTSNFAPPTDKFPRGALLDPEWSLVTLLCGFDAGIADDSSFARTVTSRNGAAAVTPDDGSAAFQAIYHHTPQDDTFIQAALLPAGSILTLTAQPANNDTVTVGSYTNAGSHAAVYKFKTVLAAAFDILIGANVAATLFNLRSAINLSAGAGTLYGTSTIVNDTVSASGLPGNQIAVTATTSGSGGNSIASTSSLTNGGGWTGTTLSGGADIPGDSDFYFDRPPNNTTIIRALEVVNRSWKTDAGSGSVQATLVGPQGGTLDGADNNLTVSPNYRFDIFETDPDTAGSITPATIVGGRVRINRTA